MPERTDMLEGPVWRGLVEPERGAASTSSCSQSLGREQATTRRPSPRQARSQKSRNLNGRWRGHHWHKKTDLKGGPPPRPAHPASATEHLLSLVALLHKPQSTIAPSRSQNRSPTLAHYQAVGQLHASPLGPYHIESDSF